MSFRIVALSDTHMYRPDIPDGDILIHAGDLCLSGSAAQFQSEVDWLANHPHKHKILIPGNHERCVESSVSGWQKYCSNNGIVMLVDESVYLAESDVKKSMEIFGCPHTPKFLNWAFMYGSESATAHWKKYDGLRPDILVTHGPPLGIHDSVAGTLLGCYELRCAVGFMRPKVHIFGHIHEGWSGRCWETWSDKSRTLFANVAVLDGRYRPATEPFVFEMSYDLSANSWKGSYNS